MRLSTPQPNELRALELLHGQREILSLDAADHPALDPPTAALIAVLTEFDCSLKEIESLVEKEVVEKADEVVDEIRNGGGDTDDARKNRDKS